MKWSAILVVLIFLGLSIPYGLASTELYASLNTGDAIGLGGISPGAYVLVTVTAGSINSTYFELSVGDAGGEWHYTSNVSGSILVTDPGRDYNLRTSGNMIRDETTGYVTLNFAADEQVIVYWDPVIEPVLPIPLIMGLVGLGSMFGGSMWMVKKAKEHEFIDAVNEGLVIMLIGIALFLGWLWWESL